MAWQFEGERWGTACLARTRRSHISRTALQVIAAVVVGGTSLAGGEGRILGTLIGALIIAVIQNGLNMAGVKSYEQKVVFGLLILGAVILDQLKTADWKRWWRRSAARQSVE